MRTYQVVLVILTCLMFGIGYVAPSGSPIEQWATTVIFGLMILLILIPVFHPGPFNKTRLKK